MPGCGPSSEPSRSGPHAIRPRSGPPHRMCAKTSPRYGPHSGLRPCRHSYHHGLVAQGCRWHFVSHHIGCRQPRQGCAKHRAHHRTRIHPHRQAAQQQTRAGTAASPRNIFGAEMQHTLGSQQRKRRHSHVIVAEYQRHLPENAIAVSPPLQMPHACSGLRKRPHLHRHHGWPTAAKGCRRYCDEKPVAVKRLALCPQIPLARSRFGPGQCCSPALVHRSAWQATPMARHTPRYWRRPGPGGQSMRHGCHRSSYHQPLPSYGHQCPPAPPRSSRRAKRGPQQRRTRSAGPEATLPQATSLPVKARAVAALIHPVHRLGSALRSGNFLATAIHVQFCEWM